MFQIGDSLFDEAGASKAQALLEKAKAKNVKIVFPVDYVTADKFAPDAQVRHARSHSHIRLALAYFTPRNSDWLRL